jgi:hypothetical protein
MDDSQQPAGRVSLGANRSVAAPAGGSGSKSRFRPRGADARHRTGRAGPRRSRNTPTGDKRPQPRGEQPIQLRQLDAVVDLDQELITDRPKKLSLPRRLRARARANQLPPPRRRRLEQLGGHERLATIDQDRLTDPGGSSARPAGRLEPESVLAGGPRLGRRTRRSAHRFSIPRDEWRLKSGCLAPDLRSPFQVSAARSATNDVEWTVAVTVRPHGIPSPGD